MLAAPAIQGYFREVARRMYVVEREPPFTAFFHATDPLVHLNYAIPDAPARGGLSAPLAALKRRFRARARVPRLEYVEEFAPDLAASLLVNGFELELRAYLMQAGPDTVKPTAPVPGLEVRLVTRTSPVADRLALHRVQRAAFGMPDDGAVVDADHTLQGDGAAFLALLDGEPAGGANVLPSADGVAEIAGVATLPALRRRGIAAAVTAAALRATFERGVAAVVLSAASAEAGRVYAAAGFVPCGATLMYVERSEDGDR